MRREIENENFKRGGKGIVNKKQKWFVREREREKEKKSGNSGRDKTMEKER